MKTPFTTEQFFQVFKDYNQSVFPMQGVFYLLVLIVIYQIIRRGSSQAKYVNVILAFFWLWMGIVYHLVFFASINPAAKLFSLLFIIQGILFLVYGVFSNRINYHYQKDKYGIAGIIFIGYALVIYPLLGWLNGHVFPQSPTFGLPCPTTIFTFGILLMTVGRLPFIMLIIPLLWSLLGSTAIVNFGVAEDAGLLIAGIFTAIALMMKARSNQKLAYSNS